MSEYKHGHSESAVRKTNTLCRGISDRKEKYGAQRCASLAPLTVTAAPSVPAALALPLPPAAPSLAWPVSSATTWLQSPPAAASRSATCEAVMVLACRLPLICGQGGGRASGQWPGKLGLAGLCSSSRTALRCSICHATTPTFTPHHNRPPTHLGAGGGGGGDAGGVGQHAALKAGSLRLQGALGGVVGGGGLQLG